MNQEYSYKGYTISYNKLDRKKLYYAEAGPGKRKVHAKTKTLAEIKRVIDMMETHFHKGTKS